MILVDRRIGSRDMIGHLRHWRVPCDICTLDYGDACFSGNGPNGIAMLGVEIKAIMDVLSCITDGRFAGYQLPGLVRTYDRTWLVLEGYIYPRYSDGILQVGRPGKRKPVEFGRRTFMYRDLDNWLTSMEICAGIKVRRTSDRIETARFLCDLYSWWQKDWADHRSHLAIDESQPDVALFTRPNLLRRVAAQLQGVGWTRSQAVASKFRNVEHMVSASVADWESIPGIGKVTARRCWESIHGR